VLTADSNSDADEVRCVCLTRSLLPSSIIAFHCKPPFLYRPAWFSVYLFFLSERGFMYIRINLHLLFIQYTSGAYSSFFTYSVSLLVSTARAVVRHLHFVNHCDAFLFWNFCLVICPCALGLYPLKFYCY
jgi:hypothetical protein